jgi:hypothetical protein
MDTATARFAQAFCPFHRTAEVERNGTPDQLMVRREVKVMNTTLKPTGMKKIVVRKPGSVRLTTMCNQYGYCNCSCPGLF